LRRIRTNIGADYIVVGSYLEAKTGAKSRVRLDVRLQDANAGEIVTSVSEAGMESDLSDIIARTAKSLRTKLAVGEASAMQAALPTKTTAAHFYSEGLNKLRNFDAQGARHSLEQAVTADPEFALAHSALANAWSRLGYDTNAAREANRAFDLSSGLSREDHLAVEANVREMNREWVKAADIYKALCSFFPDSLDYGLRLANVQTLGGNGKDAFSTVETLRRLPAPAGDDPRIDLAEAQAAKSVTDYRRMQDAAIKARNKGQKLGARMVVARAGLAEALALRNIGNPKESVAKARDAESAFLQAGDREGAASALNNIGNVLADQGDSAGGEKAYQEALVIYHEIGNRAGWAGTLGNIAILRSDAGDVAGSERLYAQVLHVDEEIGDQQSIAETLLNMANNLNTQGDLDGALKLYRRSLKIAQGTNYHRSAASALNNMGIILTAQGELGEAVQAFEEALRLHRQYDQEGFLQYPLEGLGDALQAKGDLPGAKSKLQEALEVLQRTGQRNSESWMLADLGDVYFEEGDFARAKSNYEKAMELDGSANFKGHLNAVRVQLAELAMEQGRLAEGETLTAEALKEFEAEKSRDDEVAAYSVRMMVLLQQQKLVDAQREGEKAAKLAQGMQNRYVQTKLAIARALVDAALGRSTEATRILVRIIAQTEKYGFLLRQYQARLALGEIELKTGHPNAGRERLQTLETEATARGFGLVARKASSALQSSRS
jgi:tetratricopeptide (TPR) repeat protein